MFQLPVAADKIRKLISELTLKAEDAALEGFFRGQYANHIKAAQLVLREHYTEEQLERQLQHIKGNSSTLEMVLNASRGIMPEQLNLEEDPEEQDELVQMTLF